MAGTIFRLIEAFASRGARTGPTLSPWASGALWRRFLMSTPDDIGEKTEDNNEVDHGALTTEQRSGHEDETTKATEVFPIHNELNTQVREEFWKEMRIRDARGGRSLRDSVSSSLVGCHNHPHQGGGGNGPSSASASSYTNMPPLTRANLSVPSAPGSQDYIYLPQ